MQEITGIEQEQQINQISTIIKSNIFSKNSDLKI